MPLQSQKRAATLAEMVDQVSLKEEAAKGQSLLEPATTASASKEVVAPSSATRKRKLFKRVGIKEVMAIAAAERLLDKRREAGADRKLEARHKLMSSTREYKGTEKVSM